MWGNKVSSRDHDNMFSTKSHTELNKELSRMKTELRSWEETGGGDPVGDVRVDS